MRRLVMAGFGERGVNSQVGLIVLALLAGLLVPLVTVTWIAGRDEFPRSCRAGVSTSTQVGGAITWTSASVLWFADADLNHARPMVDYSPARLQVGPSPTASAAPVLSPSPSPPRPTPPSPKPSPPAAVVPSASPSVTPSPARAQPSAPPAFEAAAISADRRTVVFLVSNPPGQPGMVSLRLVSPLDPPGTAAIEAWTGSWVGDRRDRTEVTLLPDGHILFQVPQHFDLPETSTRLVGVAETGTKPKLVESAPERAFIQTTHAVWAETQSYALPPGDPTLEGRVVRPDGTAAGILTREISTPLSRSTMHQVAVGRLGRRQVHLVCASSDPLAAAVLSPDGRSLAVVAGGDTELLDLGDGRALAPLVRGRVLDWRA